MLQLGTLGLQPAPTKLLCLLRLEELAAEDLDESPLFALVKVHGDGRGLDEL